MANIIIGMKAKNRIAKIRSSAISAQEKHHKSKRKPYVPSKWANDMVSSIRQCTDNSGTFKPSGKIIEELDKKGAFKKNKHSERLVEKNKLEGGFEEGVA